MIRCDESMRKSKERCYIPFGRRWRCSTNCQECICALFQQDDGTWTHKKMDRGEKSDKFKAEGREI